MQFTNCFTFILLIFRYLVTLLIFISLVKIKDSQLFLFAFPRTFKLDYTVSHAVKPMKKTVEIGFF